MSKALVWLIEWSTARASHRFTLRCLGVEPQWHWSNRRLQLEIKEAMEIGP